MKQLLFKPTTPLFILLILVFSSCQTNETATFECTTTDNTVSNVYQHCINDHSTDHMTPSYSETIQGNKRVFQSNSVPNHNYGAPIDKISEHAMNFEVPANPVVASAPTYLLRYQNGVSVGLGYAFGLALNGVKMDPVANFPYENPETGEQNFAWVAEATNNSGISVNGAPLNLDCNHAHLQPTNNYHYHGDFPDFAAVIGATSNKMTQVGWAGDGFPIYYKYAYSDASDPNSTVIEMTSSYQVKAGERPGDGVSAPCGAYNGKYEQDYEYVSGLGILDECNGRTGVTPEFPNGTYYYVITSDFPLIPRCFKGTPDNSFRI